MDMDATEELARRRAELAEQREQSAEARRDTHAMMKERADMLHQSSMPLADDVAFILDALILMEDQMDAEHNRYNDLLEGTQERLIAMIQAR